MPIICDASSPDKSLTLFDKCIVIATSRSSLVSRALYILLRHQYGRISYRPSFVLIGSGLDWIQWYRDRVRASSDQPRNRFAFSYRYSRCDNQ